MKKNTKKALKNKLFSDLEKYRSVFEKEYAIAKNIYEMQKKKISEMQ